MTTGRRTIAALAAVAVGALILSGCASLPFTPPNTRFTQEQIVDALGAPSSPRGYEWELGQDIGATVDQVMDDTTSWWDDNVGDPDGCFDAYAASSLTSSADRGDALGDPDFTIGRFDDDDAGDHYSVLGISVRLFSSSPAARAFVDSLADAVNACPDGYVLTEDGDVFWRTDDLRLQSERDLGASNVRAVSLEEVVSDDSASAGYRTVFLVRGNAVVAVIAEINSGSSVRFEEQDDIAKAVSGALSQLSGG